VISFKWTNHRESIDIVANNSSAIVRELDTKPKRWPLYNSFFVPFSYYKSLS